MLRAVLCALAACATQAAFAATLSVKILKRDGAPLAGAVIMAEMRSGTPAAATPVKAIMDQVNLAFAPDVLVVPVHSTVQFPNSDVVGHQVYSFSSARKFQLPLYRGKPYPPVQFDEPGIVTLGCNIHDNMVGYIVVAATPYFGRSDAHGTWSAELPAGTWRLRIWHPLMNEPAGVEREVEVSAASAALEVRLPKSLRPAPLSGRPHSWDY
jgi:plastocyanin